MSYRFKKRQSIGRNVRRVANGELGAAIDSLSNPEERGFDAAIHDARKRCKKVRGLARSVRPGLGSAYAIINREARDAAREISSIRDAHALLATYDDLVIGGETRTGADVLGTIRAELERRAEEASLAVSDRDDRITVATERLIELRSQVGDWAVPDDFSFVADAVETTYRKGRRAMRRAARDGDDDALHNWRKREKDLWYAVRLLQPAAPAVLGPTGKALRTLSEYLGEDHDLAVLAGLIAADQAAFGGPTARVMSAVIAPRRDLLQQRAFDLGAQLYAETPTAFARRMTAYWAAWVG